MRPARLDEVSVRTRLGALPGWEIADGKLLREFRFRDFPEAFAFMTRSAFRAEQLDHHPDWFNVYNRVRVTLWTHDVGGLTELDFALAEAMQGFAGNQ
ncbi:MAG: 4a-hydroxytetrahydrobiopterin dehydratase [Gammaproteobacteria bacterium]